MVRGKVLARRLQLLFAPHNISVWLCIYVNSFLQKEAIECIHHTNRDNFVIVMTVNTLTKLFSDLIYILNVWLLVVESAGC